MALIIPFLLSIVTVVDLLVLPELVKIIQNQPPKVTIVSPEKDVKIQAGEQVRYRIEVVDKEDGNSKYGEIINGEVFLEVYFYPIEIDMKSNLLPGSDEMNGLSLIMEKGCFTCHNSKTALVGPTFNKIAEKYDTTATNKLVSSIMNGSSESWGAAPMPSQLEVTSSEALLMVQWILSNTQNQNQDIYAGLTGSFSTHPGVNQGSYVLKASYTDHGTIENPKGRLTGNDQVVVKINN